MWRIPEELRVHRPEFGIKGEPFGAFMCKSPERPGYDLMIIASPGGVIDGNRKVNWEHVSVHADVNLTGTWTSKTPTWAEMDYVKALFWDTTDVVMQLHINDTRKINLHNFTLHLWRPTDKEIPLPDPDLV